MLIPTEVINIETKLDAGATQIVTEVDNYEIDLISFLAAHKWLALQILLVVVLPLCFGAFELGKHFK